MNAILALEEIKDVLFARPKQREDGVLVSSDAYYELEGALIDLKRTNADEVCIRTVERVQKQISKVHKILQNAGLE